MKRQTGNHDSCDISTSTQNAAAIITLNRPQRLNVLTNAMRAEIVRAIPRFAGDPEVYALIVRSSAGKAFCAGGDVRELTALYDDDAAAARAALAAEYAMNWQLECFSKPTLSLMDGMVMGSGAGLTLYGTHRIAAEGYSFAMPETALGLFPDVGVSSVLSRMPHEIGMYLGLTGARVGRADGFALDLVTHCIDAREFDAITAEISDADPVDPVLDSRHQDPGAGPIMQLAPVIEQCFGAPGVEDTIARLEQVRGAHRDWAVETMAALSSCSPLALKITHRLIRAAQTMDLRQTLGFDYRLACRCLDGTEFKEGVRALLIDKDGAPQWQYPRLEDVAETLVDDYFAPLDAGELDLPPRETMQATP